MMTKGSSNNTRYNTTKTIFNSMLFWFQDDFPYGVMSMLYKVKGLMFFISYFLFLNVHI